MLDMLLPYGIILLGVATGASAIMSGIALLLGFGAVSREIWGLAQIFWYALSGLTVIAIFRQVYKRESEKDARARAGRK